MPDTLHFELVSPEKLLRAAEVFMVVIPGAEGDFGVLAGHAPFMSTIRPGAIAIYPNAMSDAPERIFIAGGFAEVGDTGLTILADSAVPVSEIDPAAVAAELAEARAATGEAAEARVARLEAMQAAAVN